MSTLKKKLKSIPVLGKLVTKIYHFFFGRPAFPGSANYWENRYQEGGNSGAGSYDKLADFKADVLNNFVKKNKLNQIIEFGCGDGNQLLLAEYPSYLGLDVSPKAINICINLFETDKSKSFYLYNSSAFQDNQGIFKSELALSLDVIYHLVEDNVFHNYMTHLFSASTKYVIIYASNFELYHAEHVKDREFTKWTNQNLHNWKIIEIIKNKYKFDPNDSQTSRADFYIFQKLN